MLIVLEVFAWGSVVFMPYVVVTVAGDDDDVVLVVLVADDVVVVSCVGTSVVDLTRVVLTGMDVGRDEVGIESLFDAVSRAAVTPRMKVTECVLLVDDVALSTGLTESLFFDVSFATVV